MAGTTAKGRRTTRKGSDLDYLLIEFNKAVQFGSSFIDKIENLAAGADITERASWIAPLAGYVTQSKVLHEAASVGVDGANTVVLTLRNITEAVDIATLTLSANSTVNGVSTLAVTAANADFAANDVLGVVVTQGATADLGVIKFVVHYTYADRIANPGGTVISATAG